MSKMKLSDKIILLKEIETNYSLYKKSWSNEKVELLRDIITLEVQEIGFNFN